MFPNAVIQSIQEQLLKVQESIGLAISQPEQAKQHFEQASMLFAQIMPQFQEAIKQVPGDYQVQLQQIMIQLGQIQQGLQQQPQQAIQQLQQVQQQLMQIQQNKSEPQQTETEPATVQKAIEAFESNAQPQQVQTPAPAENSLHLAQTLMQLKDVKDALEQIIQQSGTFQADFPPALQTQFSSIVQTLQKVQEEMTQDAKKTISDLEQVIQQIAQFQELFQQKNTQVSENLNQFGQKVNQIKQQLA